MGIEMQKSEFYMAVKHHLKDALTLAVAFAVKKSHEELQEATLRMTHDDIVEGVTHVMNCDGVKCGGNPEYGRSRDISLTARKMPFLAGDEVRVSVIEWSPDKKVWHPAVILASANNLNTVVYPEHSTGPTTDLCLVLLFVEKLREEIKGGMQDKWDEMQDMTYLQLSQNEDVERNRKLAIASHALDKLLRSMRAENTRRPAASDMLRDMLRDMQ